METKIVLFVNGLNTFFENFSLWLLLIQGKPMPQISQEGEETNVDVFYYFLNYWDQFNK
jgi:hypothetical protein